jgi:alanine racemase
MLHLAELLGAGGRLVGAAPTESFAGIAYDSRMARPGELFVALRTARADGHDYIDDALAAGVTGVLCARPVTPAGVTVVQSDDPAALLLRWAATRLRHVAPLVVAVTGSVGKTSTRQALATLLRSRGPVFAGRRSFNSLLGLPVAIADLRDDARYALLEFGADGYGEIARLAQLFPPRIGIVTTIAAAHMAAFGSLEGVAQEKSRLLAALAPDGYAIIPGDSAYRELLRSATCANVLTFGPGADCDVRGEVLEYALDRTRLQISWRGERRSTWVGLVGDAALAVALAAAAGAFACGLTIDEVAGALPDVRPPPGRMRPLAARGGATLLDDTFSAAPPSIMAALHSLAQLPARRRVAILGAPEPDHMPDLQPGQLDELIASAAAADLLIGVGDWVAELANRLPDCVTAAAPTAAAALDALPADLGPGDLVLVKGGAPARLERVVARLLDPALDPGHELVRQESGWRSVRSSSPGRPTWVQVDLDAISANVRRLRNLAGTALMAVLKADAYGHGALRAARAALAGGAHMLAVATLGEARVLRDAGIGAPLLVLGYTPPWQAREAVRLGVACTLFDDQCAQAYAAAAADLDAELAVHVKADTGMARLGLAPDQVGPFLARLADLPRLRVGGLYTHFASADSADETFARLQIARFERIRREVEAAGLRPTYLHAANSAALLRFPEARLDMVRPGIACYGLAPSPETPLPHGFRPALAFYSEVAQVASHASGAPVSYGGRFVTPRPSRIATIPVGYADGLRREPSWRCVLVRGRRAPIVGRICMDYAMVDVTEIEGVRRGDAVTLIGEQGDQRISADEVAAWLGTISYEVVATILPRVPREAGPGAW